MLSANFYPLCEVTDKRAEIRRDTHLSNRGRSNKGSRNLAFCTASLCVAVDFAARFRRVLLGVFFNDNTKAKACVAFPVTYLLLGTFQSLLFHFPSQFQLSVRFFSFVFMLSLHTSPFLSQFFV